MLPNSTLPGLNPKPPASELEVPNSGELRLPMGVPAFVLLNRFVVCSENVRLYFLFDEEPPLPKCPPVGEPPELLDSLPKPRVLLNLAPSRQ